jgi:hypothetical protein
MCGPRHMASSNRQQACLSGRLFLLKPSEDGIYPKFGGAA